MPTNVTVGIVIDPWKLPIFRRIISEAGYQFSEYHVNRMITIKVVTTNLMALKETVEKANLEAANTISGGVLNG